MPFPAPLLPTALSAIRSLIRFRDRVDEILALNTSTEGLPFLLPPAPPDILPIWPHVCTFCASDAGQMLLELRGLRAGFNQAADQPFASVDFNLKTELAALYAQGAERPVPPPAAPGEPPNAAFVTKGPSTELRLAWFIVESHRLSRNHAVTRVLLAAADTLLEFGAENAGLFMRDARSRAVLETLLTEFAVKRDWDDARAEKIFRTLLGSAAAALAEHGAELSAKPILGALFGALADVREELGEDFVADIISRDGFRHLVPALAHRAATTPELLPGDATARAITAAMLEAVSENPSGILDDPAALRGVVEAGLAAAATQLGAVLDKKIGNRPLVAAVLSAVTQRVATAAAQQQLFAQLAHGEFLAGLYETALGAIAARPDLLATEAKLGAFAGELVAGFAGVFAENGLKEALGTPTLQRLATSALNTLARHPAVLAGQNAFASEVLGAVLPAAAEAAEDGFTADDLVEISDAALDAVAANLALARLDKKLQPILVAAASVLADAGLASILTAANRKRVFFAILDAIATNPAMWEKLVTPGAHPLVQSLVREIIAALATDPTQILSGPAANEVFRQVLLAAVSRAQPLIAKQTTPAALRAVLEAALERAADELGHGIDGETLPAVLRRTIDAFLREPFDVDAKPALLAAVLDKAFAVL